MSSIPMLMGIGGTSAISLRLTRRNSQRKARDSAINMERAMLMPELSPNQMMTEIRNLHKENGELINAMAEAAQIARQAIAEVKRLNEENEELRHKVKEHERMKAMGTFTLIDVMQMRGIDNPADVCTNCGGLGVAPAGTNEQCSHCGGSGHAIEHWAVLQ